MIGSREYGDLEATVAAVILFAEARSDARFTDDTYGKVREPILRVTHWARVSGVDRFFVPGFAFDATILGRLGQDPPYGARSVFNFFRPGYVATGSETSQANLVAPELQIEFGPNVIEYANVMRSFVFNVPNTSTGYWPNYEAVGLLDRASSIEGLVDFFNLIYTGNRLAPETIEVITNALESSADDPLTRVRVGSLLITNTIEYKTQK